MWSCSHTTARRLGFMCFKEIFPFSVKFAEDLLQKICAFWGSSFKPSPVGLPLCRAFSWEMWKRAVTKVFNEGKPRSLFSVFVWIEVFPRAGENNSGLSALVEYSI